MCHFDVSVKITGLNGGRGNDSFPVKPRELRQKRILEKRCLVIGSSHPSKFQLDLMNRF